MFEGAGGLPEISDGAIRTDLAEELSRRDFLSRSGRLGLGALALAAVPVAARMALPDPAHGQLALLDGTLQAFFDSIIPGKPVSSLLTEHGDPIDPDAIAGIDPEHGAVYTDALRLARNPRIGFSLLEPAFFADLTARALTEGGVFLQMSYEARERVCLAGLAFSNPDRLLWEAAAAIPFTAFCAAGNTPEATSDTSAGYRVMGHPGTAPHGYSDFSYGRKLNKGRTKRGSLP